MSRCPIASSARSSSYNNGMRMPRVLAFSLLLAALPLLGATRQRAAAVPAMVTLHGVVRDCAGAPVLAAYVYTGAFNSSDPHVGNGTNANGVYSISVQAGRPTILTVEDFQFEPVTVSITPTADGNLDFTLTNPRPTVTVTLASGETHTLVVDSAKFGWYRVFADFMKFDEANLCGADGSSFAANKNDISRI